MDNENQTQPSDAYKDELRGRELELAQIKAEQSFWYIAVMNFPRIVGKHCLGILPITYYAEHEVVLKHSTPFLLGIGSSVLILTTFRMTGKAWFQRFRHVHLFRNPEPPPMKLFLEEEQKQRSFFVDFLFSALFGAWAISYGFKPKEMRREVQDAPLLPGRSLIAESMCSDLMLAHQKYPPEIFERIERDDTVLDVFDEMVLNCKVRTRFEKLARRRNGWSDDHPVIVQEPGLLHLAVAYEVSQMHRP